MLKRFSPNVLEAARRMLGAAAPDAETGTDAAADGAILSAVVREAMIAEAAYYRAEQRGFAPGQELDDWLAAEEEVDRLLADG